MHQMLTREKFSMLQKIHTDRQYKSTVISLMTMKFNCDDSCIDINSPQDLLNKRATRVASLNKCVVQFGHLGVWLPVLAIVLEWCVRRRLAAACAHAKLMGRSTSIH